MRYKKDTAKLALRALRQNKVFIEKYKAMRQLLLTGGRRKVIIIVKSHSKIIALHITIVLLTAKFLLMMLYYTLKIAASQSFFEKILKFFSEKRIIF